MPATFKFVSRPLAVLASRSMAYNSGVFVSDGFACLIDPGPHPDEVEAALLFVASQRAEIAAVILTHSHWDHILGPERMRPELIITHSAFARVAQADQRSMLRSIAHWEAHFGYSRERPFRVPTPDATCEETIALDIGALSLQLIAAPGHAEDMLAIYEPRSRTLWAADLLSDCEIPFISHSLSAYERTLNKLAALQIEHLVPGHGQASSSPDEIRARLEADQQYLRLLRSRVSAGLAAAADLETIQAQCADLLFRAPELNSQPHRRNVESVYLELGGPGDPTQLGWHREDLLDV